MFSGSNVPALQRYFYHNLCIDLRSVCMTKFFSAAGRPTFACMLSNESS